MQTQVIRSRGAQFTVFMEHGVICLVPPTSMAPAVVSTFVPTEQEVSQALGYPVICIDIIGSARFYERVEQPGVKSVVVSAWPVAGYTEQEFDQVMGNLDITEWFHSRGVSVVMEPADPGIIGPARRIFRSADGKSGWHVYER